MRHQPVGLERMLDWPEVWTNTVASDTSKSAPGRERLAGKPGKSGSGRRAALPQTLLFQTQPPFKTAFFTSHPMAAGGVQPH